jgi:hypothetical protein
VNTLVREPEESRCIACAHLQSPSTQHPDRTAGSYGGSPILLLRLSTQCRVGSNRACRARWQLHFVHDGGLVCAVNEQFECLDDTSASFVDGSTLCVATADAANRCDPPARLVSFIGYAIFLHGFFNQPFRRHGSKSRARCAAAARLLCLHPHGSARWRRSFRTRRVDENRVDAFRRSRRT